MHKILLTQFNTHNLHKFAFVILTLTKSILILQIFVIKHTCNKQSTNPVRLPSWVG